MYNHIHLSSIVPAVIVGHICAPHTRCSPETPTNKSLRGRWRLPRPTRRPNPSHRISTPICTLACTLKPEATLPSHENVSIEGDRRTFEWPHDEFFLGSQFSRNHPRLHPRPRHHSRRSPAHRLRFVADLFIARWFRSCDISLSCGCTR